MDKASGLQIAPGFLCYFFKTRWVEQKSERINATRWREDRGRDNRISGERT